MLIEEACRWDEIDAQVERVQRDYLREKVDARDLLQGRNEDVARGHYAFNDGRIALGDLQVVSPKVYQGVDNESILSELGMIQLRDVLEQTQGG